MPDDDRPTAPLAVTPAFRTLAPMSRAADHVAIALGAERAGELDLGVTWVEGCGSADGAIVFARVLYDPADPSSSVAGTPVELGRGAVASPSIVYVGSPGFVTAGFARGAGAAADESTDGGWLVAWEDHSTSRVLARRVLELDAQPIDEQAIDLTLARAGMDPRFVAVYPPGDASRPTVGYAYFDRGARALVGGTLACEPGAPAP